jgi:hypothetical protein
MKFLCNINGDKGKLYKLQLLINIIFFPVFVPFGSDHILVDCCVKAWSSELAAEVGSQ